MIAAQAATNVQAPHLPGPERRPGPDVPHGRWWGCWCTAAEAQSQRCCCEGWGEGEEGRRHGVVWCEGCCWDGMAALPFSSVQQQHCKARHSADPRSELSTM